MTTPPAIPNFNPSTPGTGRLVTDRYDFEAHVIGTNFRHTANQIDVSPIITIGGGSPTNVQDALNDLNNLINAFTPVVATTSVLGIIQLGGDLNGSGTTATTPKVSGLQGFPIVPTPPGSTPGKVLTWGGSSWAPQFITLGGDVQGTYTSNKVTAISGPSPINVSSNLNMQSGTTISMQVGAGINVLNGASVLVESGGLLNMASGSRVRSGLGLIFDNTSTPYLKQDSPTTNVGAAGMVIQAQQAYAAATGVNKNGAFLELISGLSSSPGNGTSGNICLITDYTGTFTNALVATPSSISMFPANNTPPAVGTLAQTLHTYYNWIGTNNTQSRSVNTYSVVQTTSGTSPISLLTIPVANGQGGVIETRWIRRLTDGSVGVWGGCTSGTYRAFGGSIFGSNNIGDASQYLATGTGSSEITYTAANPTNNLIVKCTAPDSTTYDWQIIITVNYC